MHRVVRQIILEIMRLSVINDRFERVIERSFGYDLSVRGYERKDYHFYLKSGRVGGLVTVDRDFELEFCLTWISLSQLMIFSGSMIVPALLIYVCGC